MKRSLWIAAFLVLAPIHAFAQDDPAEQEARARAAQQAEANRLRAEDQRNTAEIKRGQSALAEFLNSRPQNLPPGAVADLEAKFLDFRMAIPRFREATDDYRWNLSMKSKLEKPLKSLEAQVDVLLRYMKSAKVNHPRQDSQEFKDYSQSELQWETLNAAEQISAFLDLAVAVERQSVVAPATLEFMYKLDGALLRLKWLTSNTR